MSRHYVEQAILDLKSKLGIRETMYIQKTLDAYRIFEPEVLVVFWQVYQKLRIRFIWRSVGIVQFTALLIYLYTRFCSDFTFCRCFLKIECFLIAWIALASFVWVCSYLFFVYFPSWNKRIELFQKEETNDEEDSQANRTDSENQKVEVLKQKASQDRTFLYILSRMSSSAEKIILAYKLHEKGKS